MEVFKPLGIRCQNDEGLAALQLNILFEVKRRETKTMASLKTEISFNFYIFFQTKKNVNVFTWKNGLFCISFNTFFNSRI